MNKIFSIVLLGLFVTGCSGSSCDTDIYSEQWSDCTGEQVIGSTGTYDGEWKHGMRNGQGIMSFSNQTEYDGEWLNDEMHGQGTYTFKSGDEYIGQMKDSMFHGQGTYTFESGSEYVGEWKDDNKTGRGTYTYSNGDEYIGQFKNNKFNGIGVYTFDNGTEKKGLWENDKLVGKYVGEWKDGMFTGQGTLTFENSDEYVGEWSGGKFHGQGIITYYILRGRGSGGTDKYVGEFKGQIQSRTDGVRHGQGTYTYSYGDKYVGEWLNDSVHQGTMTYKNGMKYTGKWGVRDGGIFNGQGTLTFPPNGSAGKTKALKFVGKFYDGQFEQGTITYKNGDKYVGEVVGGMSNQTHWGKGDMFFANGMKYTGEWYEGNFNSKGVLTFQDGKRCGDFWKRGDFQGKVHEEQLPDGGTWSTLICRACDTMYQSTAKNDYRRLSSSLCWSKYNEERYEETLKEMQENQEE